MGNMSQRQDCESDNPVTNTGHSYHGSFIQTYGWKIILKRFTKTVNCKRHSIEFPPQVVLKGGLFMIILSTVIKHTLKLPSRS